MKEIVLVFLSILVGVVFGVLVHEGTHVVQAYRSDVVRIAGIDVSRFPFVFGWSLGWEDGITSGQKYGFIEEGREWERQAYKWQLMATISGAVLTTLIFTMWDVR